MSVRTRVGNRALSTACRVALACLPVCLACGEPTAHALPHVKVRWLERQNSASTPPQPALYGNDVYFGTDDGWVYAYDQATGTYRWGGAAVPMGVKASNLVAHAGIVVAAGLWDVAGLDAATGKTRWRYQPPLDTVDAGAQAMPGQMHFAFLDADTALAFVPAWGASVSAIDLASGQVRWVWQPGKAPTDTAVSGVFRSGAVGVRASGDTVFATVWHYRNRTGTQSEVWLVAMDRNTGQELWRVAPPRTNDGFSVWGPPALYGNLVIFGTIGGAVWAVDRTTHGIVWHEVPHNQYGTFTGVAVANTAVYYDGGDERMYAYRASDGALLWAAATGGATTTPVASSQRLYYATYGTLHVLDVRDGREVARYAVGPDIAVETGVALASGRGYVGISTAAVSFDAP